MAEEDFEIDVYGDAQEGGQENTHGGAGGYDNNHEMDGSHQNESANDYSNEHGTDGQNDDRGRPASASDNSAPQQGVKRKQEPDDRPVDPGATNALLISDLQWWNTEDEVRGWIHDAYCEDELKDITFSEHKVNGKSKGQAYIELTSPQAATAAKHYIDSYFNEGSNGAGQQRRPGVSYHSSAVNPFKTLPKDAPQRANRDGQSRGAPAGPNFHNGPPVNNFQGGSGGGFQGGGGNFRGGRGGYNRGNLRGGFNPNYANQNMNAFNNNNNNNNNMGFNNPMGGGGFQGGGFNRGGMGGMRGGPNMRGGRGGMNGMMGAGGMGPIGGMNPMAMGGMPGNMGMNMMGGMGGFNSMPPNFNPGFFGGGNQGGGSGDWGNPHGTKRPRGE